MMFYSEVKFDAAEAKVYSTIQHSSKDAVEIAKRNENIWAGLMLLFEFSTIAISIFTLWVIRSLTA